MAVPSAADYLVRRYKYHGGKKTRRNASTVHRSVAIMGHIFH